MGSPATTPMDTWTIFRDLWIRAPWSPSWKKIATTRTTPLRENLEILKSSKDQDGKQLRVVPLPMPAPVYFDNQRLPASYANFYIANKLVMVPTFTDPNDHVAVAKLARFFPTREIIGIPCRDLVLG